MNSNYESNKHLVSQRLQARYRDAAQHRLARQAAQESPYQRQEAAPRHSDAPSDSLLSRWLHAATFLLARLVK
jgi:hypothetical protein